MTRTVGKHPALAAPYGQRQPSRIHREGDKPKTIVAIDVRGGASLVAAVLAVRAAHHPDTREAHALVDVDFAAIEDRYLAAMADKRDSYEAMRKWASAEGSDVSCADDWSHTYPPRDE